MHAPETECIAKGEPDLKRSAAHVDTGMFFACRELDAAYEDLRAHGVDVNLRA